MLFGIDACYCDAKQQSCSARGGEGHCGGLCFKDGIEGVKLLMCADRAGAPEAKR